MENQLLKKLRVKPGSKVCVLNAPENFQSIIGDLPNDINFSFGPTENYDAILIFAITKLDMMEALDSEYKQLDANRVSWIIYPKAKTKLASDLNMMQSWDDLKVYHLTPCASAAIDTIWTAIRIKPEDARKKSGQGNAEIAKSDYGNYVDVQNKIITLPEDLKSALEKQNTALSFYEQLSYSNRKEYVLWVLTAKQEKTRQERIHKTVEKLLAGKKNPSEK